jgi:hypothetical protein
MKNITRTITFAAFGVMTLMLAFGVVAINPHQAHADYGYGYSYDSGYYGTPSYNYGSSYYHPYPQNNQGPLQASCYPLNLSVRTGDSVTWTASAYGGNGSYNYTWSGTDGLSGYGSSVSKIYFSSGSKTASVTVTSGGQTITKICDGVANVYGDTSYNYPTYPTYPTYPVYPTYPTYPAYSALYVTCTVSTTYANTGAPVTWNAYPSGGNGSYTYVWSGTDNLYGSSQSVYYTYQTTGPKTASVTVYSTNGQSMTQNCGTTNIGGYYAQAVPVYTGVAYNNNNGLDVACYVDPTTARVNQPVTWRAEVTGGAAPYTYSWSGSDSLSGSDSSTIKYYSTTGDKSAIVTVKSADGRTATRACSTTATVRSASVAAPVRTVTPPVQVQPTQTQSNNGLSAAALFSLKNVPWGWVAILIILVLFATVVYLIFNRPKI